MVHWFAMVLYCFSTRHGILDRWKQWADPSDLTRRSLSIYLPVSPGRWDHQRPKIYTIPINLTNLSVKSKLVELPNRTHQLAAWSEVMSTPVANCVFPSAAAYHTPESSPRPTSFPAASTSISTWHLPLLRCRTHLAVAKHEFHGNLVTRVLFSHAKWAKQKMEMEYYGGG